MTAPAYPTDQGVLSTTSRDMPWPAECLRMGVRRKYHAEDFTGIPQLVADSQTESRACLRDLEGSHYYKCTQAPCCASLNFGPL